MLVRRVHSFIPILGIDAMVAFNIMAPLARSRAGAFAILGRTGWGTSCLRFSSNGGLPVFFQVHSKRVQVWL